MKNKMIDLRNALFTQLEELADNSGSLEDKRDRAKAVIGVAGAIIDTAKVEIDYLKLVSNIENNKKDLKSEFLQNGQIKAIDK